MVARSMSWSRKGNQRATRVTAPISMSAQNGTTRRRSRSGQRWWWTCRRGRHQGRPFKGSNWRSSTRLDRLALLFCDVEQKHEPLASQSTIFSEPLRLAAADEGCVTAHGEISALDGVPRANFFCSCHGLLQWWIYSSAGGAGLGASSSVPAELKSPVL